MPKRLIDLEIEEISGVDKAANQRQFLVIKQEDPVGRNRNFEQNPPPVGYNPLGTFHEQNGEGDIYGDKNTNPHIQELWAKVLARLNDLVSNDWSGKTREQVLAVNLHSDAELKAAYAAWDRAMKSPTEAMVDKRAREAVAKDRSKTYEQVYSQILQDSPDLYRRIREEEAGHGAGVKKNGGRKLRDVVWDVIEKMGEAVKAKEPKLTKYEANSKALDTPLGRYLNSLYNDRDAALPAAYALEKIAKRVGSDEREQFENVRKLLG